MKTTSFRRLLFAFCIAIVAVTYSPAQTTEFTYQGRLLDNALPPTANYDLQFGLWDSQVGGINLGTVSRTNVPVSNGIFTVVLDFGGLFTGTERWLEISIKPAGSPDPYVTLTGRQRITSTPYAIKSLNSDTAETASNSALLGGVPAANYLQTNGNGSGLTNINGGSIAAGTVTSSQLSPEAVPNTTAYKLLGSLRWDVLKPQATFAVGTGPAAVAFDGANIWVANSGSNNITKLRASDGVVLATIAVGNSPAGLAFDGSHIWVTNSGSNTVTKRRLSDGAGVFTLTVGTSPRGVAFDGVHIWVANSGSNTVTKRRANDGALVGTYAVGTGPTGAAFDGVNIWVTNSGSNTVTKLRASDGVVDAVLTVSSNPRGIAFDGANIWVAGGTAGVVRKLRVRDGADLGSFPLGNTPVGVAFDGANIWVAISIDGSVIKLRASDGANLGSFQVAVGGLPQGLAFDGANIWVANSGSNTVTRLPPAFPEP